jgi:hypothetical protein
MERLWVLSYFGHGRREGVNRNENYAVHRMKVPLLIITEY